MRAFFCLFFASFPRGASPFEIWVGANNLGNTSNVILWLRSADWADGISVGFPAAYTPADLIALSSSGLRLLPCVHASLETMQRQLFDSGGARAAPATALFSGAYTEELPAFRAGTAGGPGPFMWWSLTEDDSSGVGFPFEQLAVPPSTHADAWAQFDSYLQRAQVFSDALMPGVPLVAQVGFAEQAHAHFARGAALALLERANDDVGDLNTAIAFGRGAAAQFNASWGVDLSWWWGVLYSGVNRLPGAFHRRHAYLAWAAGAAVVNVEGGDGLCDGGGAALQLGAELQAFGELVRPLGARGVAPALSPVVPVLLVVPRDHGFSTRPYWLTQEQGYGYARLPPRVGDRGLHAFFRAAFPGAGFVQDPWPFGAFKSDDPPASMWALSSLTSPYAPRASDVVAAPPYLPFGTYPNRTAAREDFALTGADPSPHRPMADSTWGNIFDVAVAGAGLASSGQRSATPNNVFGGARRAHPTRPGAADRPPPLPLSSGAYRLAILLGPVNLTADVKAQLVAFVRGGGHAVVSAGVVGPLDGDLTGLPNMAPQLLVGRAWRRVGGPQVNEPFRYAPVFVPPGTPNVTVLATTVAGVSACGGGAPCALATRFSLGAGIVTTCLIPWFEGLEGLSGLADALLRDAVGAVAPLSVAWEDGAGWPVDTVAAAGPGESAYTVVVSNNEGALWTGTVTITVSPMTLSDCLELRSGAPVGISGRTLALNVGAYDVAVVRCNATW
jgi:hypothetical protein